MREWQHLAVCGDCLYMAANGASIDGSRAHCERYAQAHERNGSELVASCPDPDHVDPETGEPCHREWFSWGPCEWCGDTLGGSRYCAAVSEIARRQAGAVAS